MPSDASKLARNVDSMENAIVDCGRKFMSAGAFELNRMVPFTVSSIGPVKLKPGFFVDALSSRVAPIDTVILLTLMFRLPANDAVDRDVWA